MPNRNGEDWTMGVEREIPHRRRSAPSFGMTPTDKLGPSRHRNLARSFSIPPASSVVCGDGSAPPVDVVGPDTAKDRFAEH